MHTQQNEEPYSDFFLKRDLYPNEVISDRNCAHLAWYHRQSRGSERFLSHELQEVDILHPSRIDANPPSGFPVASLGHNERQLADKSPTEIKAKERGQRAFSTERGLT